MNITSATALPSLFEPKENFTRVTQSDKTEVEKAQGQESDESLKKNENELSQGERQQVSELQQRDTEVRAHEGAHIAAGGSAIKGGASFTYQKGPDGKQYAVGGEVPISTSGGNTPEETIALSRQIRAGALAPANPSPQDLKVASSAALMEAQARQDITIERTEELKQKATGIYEENQNEVTESKAETGRSSNIELFA